MLKGRLTIELREGNVTVNPGELFVVPRGVEHRPFAEEETELLLIEPAGTPNTGDATDRRRQMIDCEAMLLIRCPYCEMERPELEFRYAGQAHVARAADPESPIRRGLGEIPLFPLQSEGPSRRALAPSNGCGRFFNCLRDTVSDKIAATYKAGPSPGRRVAAMSEAMRTLRGRSHRSQQAAELPASTARAIAALPATRSLQR